MPNTYFQWTIREQPVPIGAGGSTAIACSVTLLMGWTVDAASNIQPIKDAGEATALVNAWNGVFATPNANDIINPPWWGGGVVTWYRYNLDDTTGALVLSPDMGGRVRTAPCDDTVSASVLTNTRAAFDHSLYLAQLPQERLVMPDRALSHDENSTFPQDKDRFPLILHGRAHFPIPLADQALGVKFHALLEAADPPNQTVVLPTFRIGAFTIAPATSASSFQSPPGGPGFARIPYVISPAAAGNPDVPLVVELIRDPALDSSKLATPSKIPAVGADTSLVQDMALQCVSVGSILADWWKATSYAVTDSDRELLLRLAAVELGVGFVAGGTRNTGYGTKPVWRTLYERKGSETRPDASSLKAIENASKSLNATWSKNLSDGSLINGTTILGAPGSGNALRACLEDGLPSSIPGNPDFASTLFAKFDSVDFYVKAYMAVLPPGVNDPSLSAVLKSLFADPTFTSGSTEQQRRWRDLTSSYLLALPVVPVTGGVNPVDMNSRIRTILATAKDAHDARTQLGTDIVNLAKAIVAAAAKQNPAPDLTGPSPDFWRALSSKVSDALSAAIPDKTFKGKGDVGALQYSVIPAADAIYAGYAVAIARGYAGSFGPARWIDCYGVQGTDKYTAANAVANHVPADFPATNFPLVATSPVGGAPISKFIMPSPLPQSGDLRRIDRRYEPLDIQKADTVVADDDFSNVFDYVGTTQDLPRLGFGLYYKIGVATFDPANGAHGVDLKSNNPAYPATDAPKFDAPVISDPPIRYLCDVAPGQPIVRGIAKLYKDASDIRSQALYWELTDADSQNPDGSPKHDANNAPITPPLKATSSNFVLVAPGGGLWNPQAITAGKTIQLKLPNVTRKWLARWLETDRFLQSQNPPAGANGGVTDVLQAVGEADVSQCREKLLDKYYQAPKDKGTFQDKDNTNGFENLAVTKLRAKIVRVRNGDTLVATPAAAPIDMDVNRTFSGGEILGSSFNLTVALETNAAAPPALAPAGAPPGYVLSMKPGDVVEVSVTALIPVERFGTGDTARFDPGLTTTLGTPVVIGAQSYYESSSPLLLAFEMANDVQQQYRGLDAALKPCFPADAWDDPKSGHRFARLLLDPRTQGEVFRFVTGFEITRSPWRWNGYPLPLFPADFATNPETLNSWLAAAYSNYANEEPLRPVMIRATDPQPLLDTDVVPGQAGARHYWWSVAPEFRYSAWLKPLADPTWPGFTFVSLFVPGHIGDVDKPAVTPALAFTVPMTDSVDVSAENPEDIRVSRVPNGAWLVLKEAWHRTDSHWTKGGGLGEDLEVELVPEDVFVVSPSPASPPPSAPPVPPAVVKNGGAIARIGPNPVFMPHDGREFGFAQIIVGAPMGLTFDWGTNPKLVNTAFPIFVGERGRTRLGADPNKNPDANSDPSNTAWTMVHVQARRIIRPETEPSWNAPWNALTQGQTVTIDLPANVEAAIEPLARSFSLTFQRDKFTQAIYVILDGDGVTLANAPPPPPAPPADPPVYLELRPLDLPSSRGRNAAWWRLEFSPIKTEVRGETVYKWEVLARGKQTGGRWASVDRISHFDSNNLAYSKSITITDQTTPVAGDPVKVHVDRLIVSDYTQPRWITLLPDMADSKQLADDTLRLDYARLEIAPDANPGSAAKALRYVGQDSFLAPFDSRRTNFYHALFGFAIRQSAATAGAPPVPVYKSAYVQLNGSQVFSPLGNVDAATDASTTFYVLAKIQRSVADGPIAGDATDLTSLLQRLGFVADASVAVDADIKDRIVLVSPPIPKSTS